MSTMWIIFSLMIIIFILLSLRQDSFSEPTLGIHSEIPQRLATTALVYPTSEYQSLEEIPGIPIHLKIPKIQVDATIEQVGLTPQGAMDVPTAHRSVAWFSLGPHPGENGSAVIDGHYGVWKNGEISVFNNLYRLQQGDILSVEDEKGMIITFIVRESRIYKQDEDVPDIFESNDGKSHLNLITFQGIWNELKRNYPNRLIIFTDRLP